ncbi:hypothetical protein [Paenibacillus polymyxa]|uniref:hypothetical protein n=1 Tax=Paenibacillus TaxID=44249 RepID=UPI00040DBE2B|nr:hypothetical protein [Paenibacillus polymyxa]
MNKRTENRFQTDLRRLLFLLGEFRTKGAVKDYKSTSDSFSQLYSIYKNDALNLNKDSHNHLLFIDDFAPQLDFEILALDKVLSKNITAKNMREYRENLISFEKLHTVKTKMLLDKKHFKTEQPEPTIASL